MSTKLYYFHDPMCSWCWGFKPTWQSLREQLPQDIEVINILGGLAPDSDSVMDLEMQEAIQNTWRHIHQQLDTEFNFDFWTQCQPRRSTYPACRAVIAASVQGKEEEMIEKIQQAYYLKAMNPSDMSTLTALAAELDLDTEQFAADMVHEEMENLLQQEIGFYRRLPVQGFPSLALEHNQIVYTINLDYHNPKTMLMQVEMIQSQAE